MKKSFFTGLVLIFPVAFTLVIVILFLNFLTKPFVGIVNELLAYLGISGKSFWFVSKEQTILILAKVLVFIFLVLLTCLIGFFAKWVSTKYFIRWSDKIIDKIPVVNKIYIAAKEVVTTVFRSKKSEFVQVVLVPFPYKDIFSLGLITGEKKPEDGKISVFVPGSPNPSLGFMFRFKHEDIRYLGMSVEEALKIIISCGITTKEIF